MQGSRATVNRPEEDDRAPVAAVLLRAFSSLSHRSGDHEPGAVYHKSQELYRQVLLRASEACHIPALPIPANQIEARAAGALRIARARLPARLAMLGKAAGRPWARDQKQSALAAWVALAARQSN